MKRLKIAQRVSINCFLIVLLCIFLAPSTVRANGDNKSFNKSAKRINANLLMNGQQKSVPSYVIEGENYLRIRDAALLLKDTPSKFSVEWNGANSVVSVQKGVVYAEEPSPEKPIERPVLLPANPVREAAKGEIELRGYRIGDHNYYRLRDMAEAFAFQIDYDAATKAVSIQTAEEKEGANSANDALYPDLSFKEIADYSNEVVRAEFIGYTDPFTVAPVEGNTPRVFRDAKFEVLYSYKGDLPEGTIITVRTLGGEVIDHENKVIISTENEDDIKFNNKHEKVLFLTKPKTGPYITNENYYISISGSQGVFDIEDNKLVNLMDTEKVFNIELLDNIDTSVDPEDIEKAQMKYNLEIGSITEEEYEDYIESLDKPIKYAEKEEYNE